MQHSIFQGFLTWVRNHPKRTAIADLNQTWTYEKIYEKATQIASSLDSTATNVRHVVVMGSKSNNSVAAILGILFADFTYCPLDINLPAARLDKIFSILSPLGLILTGLTIPLKHALKGMQANPAFILDLVGDLSHDIFKNVTRLQLKKDGFYPIKKFHKNPAYIMFTSGSTGSPKGVCISHQAADSALSMFQDHLCIHESDRICNQVALCFDLSIFDIFGSLRQGASIYLAPAALSAVPERFTQYLADKSITSLFTVPSTINYLIEDTDTNLKDTALKNLLLSGEPLTFSLLEKIGSFFPQSMNIWNLYGATEIPYVLAENITKEKPSNKFSLKGKGVEIRIEPSGELMVKSPAMLSGYYFEGSSTLYSPLKNGNWYATGDLATLHLDGTIMIHGRKDRQIKIQGHRIELDEIEHELESYEEVQQAAVIFDEDKKDLIAFVVLNSNGNQVIDPSVIEKKCKVSLPLIMCPQHYYFLSQIPRTSSGKKDRKSLLSMKKSQTHELLQGDTFEVTD